MALLKQGRWVTASGQGTSSTLALQTESLVGFYTPGALTAAKLKLQASHDGQSFVDVVDGGVALTALIGINQYVPLDATKLLGAAFIRVVHQDSGGSPVNESAERVLLPVFRTFE
jgi:hypothetical protein